MPITRTTTMREIAKASATRKRFIIAHGGARSGKTWAILTRILDLAIKSPNSRNAVIGKTTPALRNGAFADAMKILRKTGYLQYVEISEFKMKIVFKHDGATIEFFGADDPQRVIGVAFDNVFFDELDFVKRSVFDEIAMRATGQIFVAYNPRIRFWVEDFRRERADECEFGIYNYEKNEAIPETVRAELEKIPVGSNRWKIYVKGEWGSSEGTAYTGWTRVYEMSENAELVRFGLDFGFEHPTALVAVYRDGDAWVFKDMIYQSGLTPRAIVERVSAVVRENHAEEVPIVCDGARPEIIQAMRDAGLFAKSANKNAGSVARGVGEIRDLRDVRYVGDNIEREFFAYEFDEIKGQPKYKINDDALDAIRYAVDDAVAAQTKEREAAEAWSGVDLANGFVDNPPF